MGRKKKLLANKTEPQEQQQRHVEEPDWIKNEECKREIREAYEAQRQTFLGELEALRIEARDPNFTWSQHAKRFKLVPDQSDPERVLTLSPGINGAYTSVAGDVRAKGIYEPLAIMASQALGYRGSDSEMLQAWHFELILYSPHCRWIESELRKSTKSGQMVRIDNAPVCWINCLCEASAEHCVKCDTEAYKNKQALQELRQRKKAESRVQSMESEKPKPPSIKSSMIARRVSIVRSMIISRTDLRDPEKVRELAQKLDDEDIKLPSRRGPQNSKWEPKTFVEVTTKPTSREYKRIFDPHVGILARDLGNR